MSVQTSSYRTLEQADLNTVVDPPAPQSRVKSAPRPGQDPYPTRLVEPPAPALPGPRAGRGLVARSAIVSGGPRRHAGPRVSPR